MKQTITVCATTTHEVEVSLPMFRRDGDEYFAFYSAASDDNSYFRLKGRTLMCFMNWCSVSGNIDKGIEISQSEFNHALNVGISYLYNVSLELVEQENKHDERNH